MFGVVFCEIVLNGNLVMYINYQGFQYFFLEEIFYCFFSFMNYYIFIL